MIKYDLRKLQKVRKRSPRFFNFNTAKTVGVLFTYDPETEKAVEALMTFVSKNYISGRAIGYYPDKKLPENLTSSPLRQYFCKPDVNWYGKCVNPEAVSFVEQEFDILVDFNLTDEPVMHYLAKLSMSRMKVGRRAYPGNPYDFILSTGEQLSPKVFEEELERYLLTIDMRN